MNEKKMTAPPAGALEACLALLPCPWCGAEMGPATVSEGSTFRWRKVDGCCADGPEVRHNTMADDQAAAEVESTRKAIEAWNTRPALLAALRLREWRPIATCPTGEEVLLWNQETGDIFFGFKPLDAPTDDAIVTGSPHTAGYADAWMPKPDEPEAETADDLARVLEEGE